MTEIVVPEPRMLPHPATGEVISKDDPAACAKALDEVRDLEWKLKDLKRWLTSALVEEARRQGTKTLHLEGVTAVVSFDAETTEWDVTELVKLLDMGLPESRYAKLVREEISYKVDANVAKQIAGANAEYALVIERAKRKVPRSDSATIKR